MLAGKLSPKLRSDCEPLAGKSTLNRLEHTPRRHASKYHKIDCDGAQVDALLVNLFLGGPARSRAAYADAPRYVFCGRHLLLARQRRANVAGSAGAVAEMARIIGISPSAGHVCTSSDNTDIPLHGMQEGRFSHGYYDAFCYLPLAR